MQEGHFYNKHDLTEACKRGHLEIVREILKDETVDREAYDSACLYWACHNGHTEIVHALLLDDRADPSADDSGALCVAVRFGYTDIVRMLLQNGSAEPGARYNFPIIIACRNGHADVVNILLSSPRVDPAINNGVCLYWACKRGHLKVVQLLVQDRRVLNVFPRHRDDPHWPTRAFEAACKRNRTDIVELLLDRTFTISRLGLRKACDYGHVDVVRAIISRPVRPGLIDPYIRRWIDINIDIQPGSWLHGKYVARARAIAWCLRHMNQSDLAYTFVPYFMNTRIQPIQTWGEYVTRSPTCALLPILVVMSCLIAIFCLVTVLMFRVSNKNK